MKIALYELLSTVIRGGIQTNIWELSHEFCRRGHTVHLFGGNGPIREDVAGDFAVHTFPFIPRERFPDLGTRFRAFCERLSFARHALMPLRAGRYDVILISKSYDMPMALWARRGSSSRVVFKSGGTEFFPGYAACARRLDAFLACSRFNAEQIRKRTGANPDVSYYGIDPGLFRPLERDDDLASRLGIAPEDFVVVSAVRLVGWKGIQVAIEAVRDLRRAVRVRYVLVGDGDYRPRLEAQIRDLGLADVVNIVGAVPRAAIPSYYSLAHAAVFPSIGDEAFGISVVEAMACGVPAIATTSGGMPESVVDGETGFLVPPRDTRAIANALERLAQDPVRARAMGMNGRRRAAELFDWSHLTNELLAVIETLRTPQAIGPIG